MAGPNLQGLGENKTLPMRHGRICKKFRWDIVGINETEEGNKRHILCRKLRVCQVQGISQYPGVEW